MRVSAPLGAVARGLIADRHPSHPNRPRHHQINGDTENDRNIPPAVFRYGIMQEVSDVARGVTPPFGQSLTTLKAIGG